MKVHKFTLYIIDPNYEQSAEELKVNIDNGLEDQVIHYAEVESKEMGEWSDESFWNLANHKALTLEKEFNKLK